MRGPQRESFAARVLRAIAALGVEHPDGVPIRAVAYAVDIDAGAKAAKRLRKCIGELKQRGKLRRVGLGLYMAATPPQGDAQDDGKGRMWRALRLRHRRGEGVTYDELARLAGVGRGYAQDFIGMLKRRGVVERIGRRMPAVYRMTTDPVEMPELTDNADKLRLMREKRRLASSALDAVEISCRSALDAVARARAELAAMEG